MGTKIISLREYGVIYSHLPESYVRPEFDRPRLSKDSECKNIPVVELASPNRAQTVQQIGDACKNKGFFLRSVKKMIGVANEFFNLPVEEKLKLCTQMTPKKL
ncbi:hypothetical protein DVH24_028044 [Malus domestica]|uniref:Non-haem dioxygenase N-terminal domain-containing protein n=1 Tax=Malus domestica TaxID=3750 RepID=A0A498HEZ1_MALDO|nr:hypothetical protein DVH24_028044 [Malus domestica]